MPAVLILAGEASGDAYGAALARELSERRSDLRLSGTGGPAMAREGVELLAHLDQLAVMGFAEVVPRLGFFRRLEEAVDAHMVESDTRLVVLIDFPGFNMRMARLATRRRVPVLYYVAPKVWAWRASRARQLARTTDRVAAILPFEVDALEAAGVHAEYVGHPVMEQRGVPTSQAEFRARWGLAPERPLLALLPGSRQQEIQRHLGLFVEAATRVQAAQPHVLPVLSRAPTIDASDLVATGLPVVEDTRGLLRHAAAALVKSGTATLEAALEGTPSVVAYRTSRVTWWAARALLRTPYVALPNLVAGDSVVPEYLQGAATPEALARALLPLLDSASAESRAQREGFERVRSALGGPGASGRVADMAIELLGGSG